MDGVVVVYETVYGSRAYGLDGPASDRDLRGVFVGPRLALHGYRPPPEQVEPAPERVLYDVRKLFRLAAACNPTVIEMLFTDASDHITVTPAGERLLALRRAFLSRRAGGSFGRYGLAQLKRIKTHRRWLLSPPPSRPRRADFGLPERSILGADEKGAAEALLEKGRLSEADLPPHFMDVLDRERRYQAAAREWQHYEEWRRDRNPKRAALEAQFGYDTKHAMHLTRLMRMGVEILQTGEVRVRRSDAPELRAIRDGALSFEQLLAETERLEANLLAAERSTGLPDQPDEDLLDRACADIVEQALGYGS
jgi:predicted nucleotidyltransferase